MSNNHQNLPIPTLCHFLVEHFQSPKNKLASPLCWQFVFYQPVVLIYTFFNFRSYPPGSGKVIFVDAFNNLLLASIVLTVFVVIFLPLTTDTLISLSSSTSLAPLCLVSSARSIGSSFQPISLLTHKSHHNKYLPPKFSLLFLLPLSYLFSGLFCPSSFSFP